MNPSIELETNRYDRVIGMTAYNEAGAEILNQSRLMNRKIDEAIEELLAGGLGDYVADASDITLTVQCRDNTREKLLLGRIQEAAGRMAHPHSGRN